MPKAQPLPKYRVSLRLGTNIYTVIAGNVIEAIEKMQSKLPPTFLSKAKGVLTVTCRGLKTEIMMFPPELKKLFINKTAREMFQKRALGVMK